MLKRQSFKPMSRISYLYSLSQIEIILADYLTTLPQEEAEEVDDYFQDFFGWLRRVRKNQKGYITRAYKLSKRYKKPPAQIVPRATQLSEVEKNWRV